MKLLRIGVLFLSTALVYSATAADGPRATGTPEPPPIPPLLATQLPSMCQWTVDYTYTSEISGGSATDRLAAYKKMAAQDPDLAKELTDPHFLFSLENPRPVHTLVVKTSGVQHDVRNLERSYVDELWRVGDAVVEKKPDLVKLDVSFQDPSPGGQFPEFKWISTSNFTGRKKLNGVDCLVFQTKLNPLRISHPEHFGPGSKEDSGSEDTLIPVAAYVVDQTRLPVALQTPMETRRYTFLTPPTTQLTPPGAIVAAAQEARSRVEATTRPLSPP